MTIGRRARDLGFTSTLGILHDGSGPVAAAVAGSTRGLREISGSCESVSILVRAFRSFPGQHGARRRNNWHCRAGGRFLYICEDGLVHYCSQQRGLPGIPLTDYTKEDVRREAAVPKSCAPQCTISCAHQTAMFDEFREHPRQTLNAILDRRHAADPGFRTPASVRALSWMFLDERRRGFFRKMAARLLAVQSR